MRYLKSAIPSLILILLCSASPTAQSAAPGATQDSGPKSDPVQIRLVVSAGTPLRVALRERVRVKNPGEPVRGVLTNTVYAFDEGVIPVRTEVYGKITRVDPIPKKKRILALANGDFTPLISYGVTFDSLELPDGTRIAIATQVSSGTEEVVHLVTDPRPAKKKNVLGQAAETAKKQVTDTAHSVSGNIKSPGRVDRIKRYLVAQLPFRRQYLEPGTRFNAVLEEPLEFGTAARTGEELAALGTPPAEGSVLDGWLANEVSSATAKPGTPVEAIITKPLFSPEQKLTIPAHSKVVGEVVKAEPARKLHHNGQLRVVLARIELPEGVVRPVRASLAGIEVDRAAGLVLDAESGVRARDGKARYASTALSIAIAVMAAQPDYTEPGTTDTVGDPGVRTLAGGSGMRLVGAVASLAVRSQVLYGALGVYGAACSVYSHFLSRGREVTLPKGTPVEIGFAESRQPPNTAKR